MLPFLIIFSFPTPIGGIFDSAKFHNPAGKLFDYVVRILRSVIERRHGRHNIRTHTGKLRHIFKMYFVKRSFVWADYKLSVLLQCHIRRTNDQFRIVSVRNGN